LENAVRFRFAASTDQASGIKVEEDGDIILPRSLKSEVGILFTLATKQLSHGGRAYAVSFKPNGSDNIRRMLRLQNPKTDNSKKEWPYEDGEFYNFRLSDSEEENRELRVTMRNEATHQGALIDYQYGLTVSLRDRNGAHVAYVEHDPVIRNGGGSSRVNPTGLLRPVLAGFVAGAVCAIVLLRAFSW